MSFTKNTIDFLFENRLHDSREWFHEHKREYQNYVIQPMTELISAVAPTVEKIDKLIAVDPKRISRIYRDARYAKDSVFRDYVWYTFCRAGGQCDPLPGFYFSIGTSGISYGCGYYRTSAKIAGSIQKLILEDDKSFSKAVKALKQSPMEQYGQLYKRSKYPNESAQKQDWLNRKEHGVSFAANDPEIMFSDTLAQRVANDFKTVSPVYDFYMLAEEIAARDM